MTDFREHVQRSLGAAYVIERELGGGGMSHHAPRQKPPRPPASPLP